MCSPTRVFPDQRPCGPGTGVEGVWTHAVGEVSTGADMESRQKDKMLQEPGRMVWGRELSACSLFFCIPNPIANSKCVFLSAPGCI